MAPNEATELDIGSPASSASSTRTEDAPPLDDGDPVERSRAG
jgi:hypothetical protein